MRTKEDIQNDIEKAQNKLNALQKELQRFENALDIDSEKPFCKMNLAERNLLFDYDKSVYSYFQENPKATIAEYNNICGKGKEILLLK